LDPVRELIGDCNPKEWDGTTMFAGHEWVSRKEVTERFMWATEEEVSIWGVKGCGEIKCRQKKCLIVDQVLLENG
jgi:hypothetical protein